MMLTKDKIKLKKKKLNAYTSKCAWPFQKPVDDENGISTKYLNATMKRKRR